MMSIDNPLIVSYLTSFESNIVYLIIFKMILNILFYRSNDDD